MQLGYLQFDPQTRNVSDNVSYIIKKCHSAQNSLIVFPELCFTSYYDLTPTTLQSLNQDLAPLITLSLKNNLTFVGTVILTSKSIIQNRIFYIQGRKLSIGHAKHKLFAQEKSKLTPGKSSFTVINYHGVKIGTCICLDILNPAPIQKMVLNEIDLLLIPSTVSLDYLWTIAKARSLENQIITVFTNRSGQEKSGITYLGRSTIFYPDGKVSSPITKSNQLLTTEISNEHLNKTRSMRKYLEII